MFFYYYSEEKYKYFAIGTFFLRLLLGVSRSPGAGADAGPGGGSDLWR